MGLKNFFKKDSASKSASAMDKIADALNKMSNKAGLLSKSATAGEAPKRNWTMAYVYALILDLLSLLSLFWGFGSAASAIFDIVGGFLLRPVIGNSSWLAMAIEGIGGFFEIDIFPFWLLFVFIAHRREKKLHPKPGETKIEIETHSGVGTSLGSIIKVFLIILVVLVLIAGIAFLTQSTLSLSRSVVKFIMNPSIATKEIGKWMANIALLTSETKTSIKNFWDKQYQIATSDYYIGQVEENKDAPLGVKLEDLSRATDEFYSDEDVDVWATLSARTLSNQEINITNNCYIEYSGSKVEADRVFPKSVSIYNYGEETINCRFSPSQYNSDPGSYRVHFTSTFNFDTFSYFQINLIDFERVRTLKSQNIDPYVEYQIEPREPIAIYTQGPISIGMEMRPSLIEVKQSQDAPVTFAQFGITIDNEWGPDGKIINITSLKLILPKEIEFVKENCFFEPLLVSSQESDVNEYNVSVSNLREIKNFKSFRCQVKIDPNIMEPDNPLTVRYIKASISYVYELDKAFVVTIKDETLGIAGEEKQPLFVSTIGDAFVKCGKKEECPSKNLLKCIYADYKKEIDFWEQQSGIPRCLAIASILQESAGDPCAISNKGAVGLLQLMPGTAYDMEKSAKPSPGLTKFFKDYKGNSPDSNYVKELKELKNSIAPQQLPEIDSRFLPYSNIGGGMFYYNWLIMQLEEKIKNRITDPEERIKLMLAAYNWGIGNVMKYCCDATTCSISKCSLPPETKNHINKIYPNYQKCKNELEAGKWDITPPPQPEITMLKDIKDAGLVLALAWNPHTIDQKDIRYKIYRKRSNIMEDFQFVADIPYDKTYAYIGVEKFSGTYTYKVRAIDSQNNFNDSEEMNITLGTTHTGLSTSKPTVFMNTSANKLIISFQPNEIEKEYPEIVKKYEIIEFLCNDNNKLRSVSITPLGKDKYEYPLSPPISLQKQQYCYYIRTYFNLNQPPGEISYASEKSDPIELGKDIYDGTGTPQDILTR